MYSFATKVQGDLETIEQQVVSALKDEGFGVLTEINVQAVMKQKLDLDRRPYKILGACNPSIANQALDAEPDIGLLLPCNVVIREENDSGITVAFMDPEAVLDLVGKDDIAATATEVKSRLLRVRDAIGGVHTS